MEALKPASENFLVAVAQRIVPELAEADEGFRKRFLEIVDEALMSRPKSIRKQFAVFLKVLRFSTITRSGKPLDKLKPAKQDAALKRFENHRVTQLRRGFWGLKTMVFMGYYGQPEIGKKLHYTPSLHGNEMLK